MRVDHGLHFGARGVDGAVQDQLAERALPPREPDARGVDHDQIFQ
ncbi:MAG: hypothetical protein R3F43_21865 [bacterium]